MVLAIRTRYICTHARAVRSVCAPVIDGLGHATWSRPRPVATSHRLASVIVSGFRAALDLNTYPLRKLIRPRCAERAKPGRGKPVLIMPHIILII